MRSFSSWTCKLPMLMFQTLSPDPLLPRRKILLRTQPSWRGGGRGETSPPSAAIDSSEGGVSGEGKTEEKNEDAPADLPEGPSLPPS
ncbi:UNVERIFIED_CONTAM: hypothetical protein Sradi_3005800 [Sesamum radiatum]|uniref:Uncharacterized protein n=1 Tax=Sesamum radiatum TaxID=300843 RepID=A0AAW2S1Y3_SESRA